MKLGASVLLSEFCAAKPRVSIFGLNVVWVVFFKTVNEKLVDFVKVQTDHREFIDAESLLRAIQATAKELEARIAANYRRKQ